MKDLKARILICFVVIVPPAVGIVVTACTPAQQKAFVDDFGKLAGQVCAEHDDWAVCVKKCKEAEQAEER